MCPHTAKYLEDAVHIDALVLLALRLLNVELCFLRDIQRDVLWVSNLLNFFVVIVVSPTVDKSKYFIWGGGGCSSRNSKGDLLRGGSHADGGLVEV